MYLANGRRVGAAVLARARWASPQRARTAAVEAGPAGPGSAARGAVLRGGGGCPRPRGRGHGRGGGGRGARERARGSPTPSRLPRATGPLPGCGSQRSEERMAAAGRRKEGGGGARPAPAAARPAPCPPRRRDSVPRAWPRSPGLAGRGGRRSGGSRDCGKGAPRAPSNEGAAAACSLAPPPPPPVPGIPLERGSRPLGLPGP
nr:myosin IC heavy chain-like [Camelus dromedarius]